LLASFKTIDQWTLADVDAMRITLGGGSVIDWQRLNFNDSDIESFLRVHEFNPNDPEDQERMNAIRNEAIDYLRRNFGFPVPTSVQNASAFELFRLASGRRGHRQVCACTVLKAIHIIHHLQGRELLMILPLSDAEVFHLVEQKVYGLVGEMMAAGLPVVEFLGGRKNRDSLYTKLLSKRETIAAQIYDKLRFRIVTRTHDDLFPVCNFLMRRLFPFNFVIPGESKNTLIDFRNYCLTYPNLEALRKQAQGAIDDAPSSLIDNKFSAKDYRVIHFVVDLPLRVPDNDLLRAPIHARQLGKVIFALTEFQVVDQITDEANEIGEASHSKYKDRQRRAVMERLGILPPQSKKQTRETNNNHNDEFEEFNEETEDFNLEQDIRSATFADDPSDPEALSFDDHTMQTVAPKMDKD